MEEFNAKQLEMADEFVNSLNNESDESISKIVAGMTAIINGNEKSYEWMKNQKWFERIWYGLTLKNKATVKEMQSKRDMLTKYTVQILVKMNELLDKHSNCIHDLYRALAVVRCNMDAFVNEVNHLAVKLNEKIIRLDKYQDLITDIQNGKFDTNTPLISLIEIMSLIDSKTASEAGKLMRLKETMQKAGFKFTEQVDISTYSNEILSLSEESVGRILLFCQSFAHRSRFLAYTSALIQNYYYLGECDRQIVKENGEAVRNALEYATLSSEMSCNVDNMFTDIKNYLPDSFPVLETSEVIEKNTSSDNTDTNSTVVSYKPIRLLITGMKDSGKHILASALRKKYPFKINVTDGFSLTATNNEKIVGDIKQKLERNDVKVVLLCLSSLGGRFDNYLQNLINDLSSSFNQVEFIVVLTKCVSKKQSTELQTHIQGKVDCNVACVLIDEWQVDDEITVSPFGIDELIKMIRQSAI